MSVSVYVLLKPETKGVIIRADLAAMKPRALIVNTSRLGLMQTGALEAVVAVGQ